jgi:hypothetical protein
MKTLSRILPLLTFLILVCPFYQTCSDRQIIEERILKERPSNGLSESSDSDIVMSRNDMEKIIYNFIKTKKELTLNGYEIINSSFRDFTQKPNIDNFNLLAAIFILSLIINICVAFYIIFNNYKVARNLSFLGSIFGFTIFYMFSLESENFEQIKYGTYLYVLNLIAISLTLIKLNNELNCKSAEEF